MARRVAIATAEAISCGQQCRFPGGISIPRDGFAPARHDVGRGHRQDNRQRLMERILPVSLSRTACAVTTKRTAERPPDVIARRVTQAIAPGHHCEVCREQSERPLKQSRADSTTVPWHHRHSSPDVMARRVATATAEAISGERIHGFSKPCLCSGTITASPMCTEIRFSTA